MDCQAGEAGTHPVGRVLGVETGGNHPGDHLSSTCGCEEGRDPFGVP